jgi:SAM-dependent methyltransferase
MIGQLYVGGLGASVGVAALEDFFSRVTAVDSVEIAHELETGKPVGYGVVRLDDKAADEVVSRLDGAEFAGGKIVVRRMPLTLPGEMDARAWLHDHAAEMLKAIGVKRNMRVLDYGCGPGMYTIPCAGIVGPDGVVYALDVQGRVLERVREKAREARLDNIQTMLQPENTLEINLPRSSVDVFMILDVMHAIRDKVSLLKEAARVLKPAGFLSVFPMHLGDERFLASMETVGLFTLRDAFVPPNSQAPSSVLNFTKKTGQ